MFNFRLMGRFCFVDTNKINKVVNNVCLNKFVKIK